MFNIPEELKKLPQKPGVYIMKDERENVIYVGKAINLKNRVRSYFQDSNRFDPKVRNIRSHIESFEYIVVDTEVEALILECNLIKRYNPKYNVLLKDDREFPYIKLTMNEDFPRVFSIRKHEKDGGKYFGPYTSSYAVYESLELIAKLWPLRQCQRSIAEGGKAQRPCLNYHIGGCKAPCAGKISREEYRKIVAEVEDFLNGKHGDLLKRLQEEMLKASEELRFEDAAGLRDKFLAVRKISEKQKIDTITGGDQDIIAFARTKDEALVQVFFFRNGKMTGRDHFMMGGVEGLGDEEVMTGFVTQYYSGTPFIPRELVIQWDINDRETVTQWLSKERGNGVSVTVPRKGEKKKLVDLAAQNAAIMLEQFGEQIKREKQRTEGALAEIAKALAYSGSLQRIESYDISNIQGFESVGSMVVFENGRPKNNDYRKFKIKTVIGANDFASMEEVLTRRFNRYVKEKNEGIQEGQGKFSKLPDFILVDGGKPQISAVESALSKLGISIPVCGMIKDDKHRTRGLLYRNEEITLPYSSEGFKLVTRIQDEVHRFAIEYHRKLRAQTQVRSVLDDIKGIGGVRRRALLKHFGSIEAIRKSDREELCKVPGLNAAAAEAVYKFFNGGGK